MLGVVGGVAACSSVLLVVAGCPERFFVVVVGKAVLVAVVSLLEVLDREEATLLVVLLPSPTPSTTPLLSPG